MRKGENELLIAIAGNPNAGKTTIFNGLTGANQHVGNYPGVTVEKKEGHIRYTDGDQKLKLTVVDLPGTYSLSSYSEEERVARGFLLHTNPDATIVVMDAAHLQRHLAFALQLIELERPLVLDLNMMDEAAEKGYTIDTEKLAKIFGVAVCPTVGRTGEGLKELLKTAVEEGKIRRFPAYQVDYGPEVEERIAKLIAYFDEARHTGNQPHRWMAVTLLEGDQEVREWVTKQWENGEEIVRTADQMRQELQEILGGEPELHIVSRRSVEAARIMGEVSTYEEKPAPFSSKLDHLLTHRIWGLPIFFFIMWATFNFVFTFGEYPQGWIEEGVGIFSDWVSQIIPEGELHSLIVDGIIGGVGSVLSFLPNIILLFLVTAFMEDTGYLARAAFLLDRGMKAIGLQGKAFIPYFIGFGCTVPAVMGTRILESPRDRMTAILTVPFISCNARLPVYTLLIGAFFPSDWAGTVLFGIYIFGILIAIFMAFILRKFVFPGEDEPFVMELPPYRMPTLWGVVMHMWERSILYIQKAGTIILMASVLIWFITSYPQTSPNAEQFEEERQQVETQFTQQVEEKIYLPLSIQALEENEELVKAVEEGEEKRAAHEAAVDQAEEDEEIEEFVLADALEESEVKAYALHYFELLDEKDEKLAEIDMAEGSAQLENSYAGRLGHVLEPVIKPLGFDWKIGVGLVGAFAAKEVLVSTLGIIYSVEGADEEPQPLQEILAADPTFSPLVAICLMVFSLLYCPCLAVIGVIRRETQSFKWPAIAMIYPTILAWIVTFIIYQGGTALGF